MRITLILLLGVLMASCSHLGKKLPPAPVAQKKPKILEKHGDKRSDPYFWMKDREDPAVIQYLKDENAYVEKVMAPVKDLEAKLYDELRGRIKEDDSSVPFRHGPYFYYSRYETGREYPIYARKKGALTAREEILLDVNELAKGHTYFSVPFPKVSPDHTKIIYAVDDQGRRFYDLRVKDLGTGKDLPDLVTATTGNAEWASDNETFFYTKQHPETLRSQWAYRHVLGGKRDKLIFEEKDETFWLGLSRSRTGDFLFLVSGATLSHEWRYLDANKPDGKFQVFLPRERNHEYDLVDGGDAFYIYTNWKAKNFRLMKAPREATPKAKWAEVIAHRSDVFLESADFFGGHYTTHERVEGLSRIRVVDRKTGESSEIRFPDPTYVVEAGTNEEYETDTYRYSYESLNRPESVFDYHVADGKSEIKKQKETPNLDPSKYASDRVWAEARDGTRVPVSLLYKKGFRKDGKAPILIYAYGSYGYSMEPWFSTSVFSLVDRGFVYAIAHIRGGSEMGRQWYDDGKLLQKKNTFTDFIDCTKFLVKEKYASPGRVYAQGGSAGGLLMGAVINMAPELYNGVHAAVPFVDVMTTMLDDSIPLTTAEYDEWGNPNKKEYYTYMRSYSPYDNVTAQKYPNLLITSGLHDSQVQYWEPTKWAAKLRKVKKGDSLVLLRTEMEAGHGGASGRFERLKETAREYAFFLLVDGGRR